jgi:hypothetical protein
MHAGHAYGWGKEWKREADMYSFTSAKPVTGIYIGKRTYSNGITGSPEDGCPYEPKEHFEVWLIVPNERSKPVPVYPADCNLTQEKS